MKFENRDHQLADAALAGKRRGTDTAEDIRGQVSALSLADALYMKLCYSQGVLHTSDDRSKNRLPRAFIALLILFFKVPADWLPVRMLPSQSSIKEQSCNKIIKSSPSSAPPSEGRSKRHHFDFSQLHLCVTSHKPRTGPGNRQAYRLLLKNRELLKAIHCHLKTILDIAPFITPF